MKIPQVLSLLCLSLFILLPLRAFTATIHVKADQITGNQDGSSWENAMSSLSAAIMLAQYGDEIWVAQGTYYPTNSTVRGIPFSMKNGVKIFGGFSGIEQNLEERDWEAFPTILSGDIGLPGDSTDNSYTVIICSLADSTTILDGLIISDGNADGTGGQATNPNRSGGGLYISGNASPEDIRLQVINCRFIGNTAKSYGGGAFVQSKSNGGASPTFMNCYFQNNQAFSGGGIEIRGASEYYEIMVTDCWFQENRGLYGGGLSYYNNFGSYDVKVQACSFIKNSAVADGGGIDLQKYNSGSMLHILESDFEENVCNGEGYAVSDFNFTQERGIYIYRCNFNANYGEGEAILIFLKEDAIIESCVFSNTNTFQNSAINSQNCKLQFINCQFSNLTSEMSSSILSKFGFNSIESIASFTNCIFTNNKGNNGYLTHSQVPSHIQFNNCIIYDNFDTGGSLFNFSTSGMYSTGTVSLNNTLIDRADCSNLNDQDTVMVNCGPGMLFNVDPMFVDTSMQDYRLHPCSPALNAGDNSFLDSTILLDLAGNPRIVDDIVDIGAFEVQYPISIDSIQDLSCFGFETGAVFFSFDNAVLPLDYEWSNDIETGSGNTNLSAGTYSFTLTDAEGCNRIVEQEITIHEAMDLHLDSIITHATGMNIANGAIQVGNFSGGTAPYQFDWSTGQTSASIIDLLPGVYSLTVTDGNDCEYVYSFTVDFILADQEPGNAKFKGWISPGIVDKSGSFTLYLDGAWSGRVNLRMWNAQGMELINDELWKPSGKYSSPMIAPAIPGIYFLKMNEQTLRLIVIR